MPRYKFIIFSILNVAVFSCVSEVPLKIESLEQVTVNCLLHSSEKQVLNLAYSRSLGGGIYFEPVEDKAVVRLYKNDTLVGNFIKAGSRTWEIEHVPAIGTTYRIEIEIAGKKTLMAITTIPAVPIVNMINETAHKKTFEQEVQHTAQWIYAINAQADASWENPVDTPEIKLSDRLIENIGTNHPAVDMFNQNGGLADVIPDATLPAYDFYIRINPETVNTIFDIEAAFYPNCFIVFRNASFEYDQYLKSSLQKMFIYIDEDDPLQWFDENQIFNNIENGIGIFAAYSDKIIVIGMPIIPLK